MNRTRGSEGDEPERATEHALVIGGNRFGLAVAEYLIERTRSVTYASATQPAGIGEGVEAIHCDIADANDVRDLASEVTDVDLVVALGSDSKALLTGHLVRQEFGPCVVVAGVSDPSNAPAFEGTGVDPIDTPRLLADAVRERYE